MPVSVPFFEPSAHDGSRQTLPVQIPLAQSPGTAQALPVAQSVQLEPQSRSVSVPFFTPSVHVGVWQTPAQQKSLWQSPHTLHACPLAQGAQAPPQSTAV